MSPVESSRIVTAEAVERTDAEARTLAAADAVEVALADGIRGAVAAGRWDVVAQLARELEARRLCRADVPSLDVERVRRRGPA